ncbi:MULTISPECIES: enoyl-CoA hydratase-related protein [Sphingomonas]|uniref:2-(1,2-epoxy-1,2-dihydrophenyl)acetyl-CoA isomerase n=1 Tax=Sphingomonas adhaesiva TaxID=28212 RepID=A0A2A4I9F8_9SPHN|nr:MULTISPECIES: enoyl-CoA hydratase-related protein [Sphingomonas]PCG14413.1 2-(1,2-epoxy-1,2-dihydrophenyl)acetyl-CoA isomerase [Sphingomonas adhaesiva]PZU80974.1 MAG: 2-(1,2-epoxy-1,2-dihydrophenyl)acetyl-CoA isomerase [Sphingomonas sp.]
MAEYETILTERKGDVLVVTLNRPERLNAASLQMADDLSVALYDLQGARALLITGAGRAFCSGADLQARGGDSAVTGGDASHRALMNHYNPALSQIMQLDIPVVTAVNGPAAGVGCSIGLAGDFVFAGRSAYFLQAFVNIGLVPDGGSTWLLTKAIGKPRATQMMMLGERIGAEQAQEWGLIYKAVDDAALMDEALALATKLAAGPTVALSTMRRNILTALDGSFDQVLRAEAEGQRRAGGTADAREGALSFIQKRKPAFTGR